MSKVFSNEPLFTVLIATKDDSVALRRCLGSLIEQTFDNFEVIVKDGLSSDNTAAVVEEASEKLGQKLKFISSEDTSITQAWNDGLQYCTGRWLYILGADDKLHSRTTLNDVAQRLVGQDPAPADIYFGAVELFNNSAKEGMPWVPSEREILKKITAGMPLSHQSIFVRRETASRIRFDERWKLAADYDFLIRAVFSLRLNIRPLSDRPILISRVNTGGLSGNPENALKVLLEYRKIQRRAGIPISPRWLWAALKSFIKISLIRTLGRKAGFTIIDLYRISTGRAPRHSRLTH